MGNLTLLGFYYDKKESWRKKNRIGYLMISIATAKKGKKAELFKKLINFDVGPSTFSIRNIEDIMVNSIDIYFLEEILKRMSGGHCIMTLTGNVDVRSPSRFSCQYTLLSNYTGLT